MSDSENDSQPRRTPNPPTVEIPLITLPLVGETCKYDGREFICVDHGPNSKNGSDISPVWDHGTEHRELANMTANKWWRCGHCKRPQVLQVTRSTGTALRHLRSKHRLKIDKCTKGKSAQAQGFISTLVTRIWKPKFVWLLIRWIVCTHSALSTLESPYFFSLIEYIAPAVSTIMSRSGNAVRRWIMREFDNSKAKIRLELTQSLSKIHISFDLWTSPNSLALVAVVAHYLGPDLKNHSLLIGIRRVDGCHSGENIATAIIPLLKEMVEREKLGFFQGDNAGTNDTAIRCILQALRPDIRDPGKRRVRCLGHIINLAARAFLFGKDAEAFEAQVDGTRQRNNLEQLQELWRQKGPIGKIHNTIVFIRASVQRRQEFSKIVGEQDIRGQSNSHISGVSALPASFF
jgi:hypothetical protein